MDPIQYNGPSGGDTTPPDGDITSPSEGATITNRTVYLGGWGQDNTGGSGFNHAHFTAYYNGSWRQVGPDFYSSPFGFDWDMCNDGVPDGSVTLGLDLWDNAGNAAYSPRGNRHFTKSFNCTPSCNPNSDQIALYANTDYGGTCVTLGVGDYPNPGYLNPLGNDNAESIKLGGNVQAILYEHDNYNGRAETFTGNDSNLNDNYIGGNVVSSVKVQWRSQPPAAPTLQSPSNGSIFNEAQGITLSWSDTGDEYYGEVWGGPAGTTPFGWQTGTSKNIGSQWAGYTYSWHVKARNSAGESGWSSTWTFTVRPAAPSSLSAQPVSCSQVSLTWNDNSGNEEGYRIYRNGSYVGQVGANVTTYQDTGLSGSTTYSYYVKAFRGSIYSDASNTANATTLACDCPPITEWKGEYWSNPNLNGSRILCRNDFALDFDWWTGSPDPIVPADGFSARWTRAWDFPAGTYRFHMHHDDGARLYVDDVLKLDKWGTCCVWDTVDLALSAGSHTVRMEMFENGGAANARLWWERLDISGWRGEYYNNDSLSDHPILVRDDGTDIDFEWASGSPDPLVRSNDFSARWTRSIWFPAANYVFDIFHDDGARLYVDGVLVFENWCDDCRLTESVAVTLSEGTHDIKLEMFENGGWAAAGLTYSARPTCGDTWEPNDDPDHATSLSYGESKSAKICAAGDLDYYRFTGQSADPVVIDMDARANGSALDSYIFLYDSDGVTTLAQNDDASCSLDSKLGYTLPHDGTYYIKVREYSHPSEGGDDYFYTIRLARDSADPSYAAITHPASGGFLDPNMETVWASAADNEGGVHRVEFLWHDADWGNPDWQWLGADYCAYNGYSWGFDTSGLPEQSGAAFCIWAFDWIGHSSGAGVGGLVLDRSLQRLYLPLVVRNYRSGQPADWSDNFDSYPTGISLHGVGGWKGWNNSPAATAYTREMQVRSVPNSVEIMGTSDLVHEYSGRTSGVWYYTAWQYIPTSFSGESYFILLNEYADGGDDNWSTQVKFDSALNHVVNDGPAGGVLTLIKGQWVEIRVEIDLDNDVQKFYYGGDLLFQGSWTGGMSGGGILNIAAVDLWANHASAAYYDDMGLTSH